MKTNYAKLLMLTLLSLTLWSCDKDEDLLVMKSGEAATLTASQTNMVLKEEDKTKDAVTFSWSKTDFGYDAAVNYSLEFGKKGDGFAKLEEVEVGSAMMKTLKVSELNLIANNLGMKGFEEGEMEVRVKSSLGAAVAPIYSAATTLMVTPFLAEPEWPVIYLVGPAAENGWNEKMATPFFRDENDLFVYTLTSKLKAGDFKMLGKLGQWGPAWGMGPKNADGSVNLAFRPTPNDADVDPITGLVPADGYYTITVNLRNNTVKVEPYDAGAGAPVYPSIGVLGDFSNWDAVPDQQLTNTAWNPHIWTTEVTLPAKTDPKALSELKLRVGMSWNTNWGAQDGKQEAMYGVGKPGGGNFKLKPGKYKVLFNDLTAQYVFIKL